MYAIIIIIQYEKRLWNHSIFQGADGPAGEPGDKGIPSSVVGPKGDVGLQGPKGMIGDPGPKGDKGDDSTEKGMIGDTGPQGNIALE